VLQQKPSTHKSALSQSNAALSGSHSAAVELVPVSDSEFVSVLVLVSVLVSVVDVVSVAVFTSVFVLASVFVLVSVFAFVSTSSKSTSTAAQAEVSGKIKRSDKNLKKMATSHAPTHLPR
jgi:hypothetical protein